MLYCPRSTDCSRFLRFRCLANGELSRILNGRSLRSQHHLRFCSHRSETGCGPVISARTFSSRKISRLSSRPVTIVIEGVLMLKLRYGYDRWKHPLIQGVAQIPPDANNVLHVDGRHSISVQVIAAVP